jgi:hypothetical protein
VVEINWHKNTPDVSESLRVPMPSSVFKPWLVIIFGLTSARADILFGFTVLENFAQYEKSSFPLKWRSSNNEALPEHILN